jgi:hypothetical protein
VASLGGCGDNGTDGAVGFGEDVELAAGVDRELGIRAPVAGDEGPTGSFSIFPPRVWYAMPAIGNIVSNALLSHRSFTSWGVTCVWAASAASISL